MKIKKSKFQIKSTRTPLKITLLTFIVYDSSNVKTL